MALVSASTPSLQYDDEETLKLLVQDDPQVVSRLEGFQARLEEDFEVPEGNDYWENLMGELNANFKYASTPLPASSSTTTNAASASKDGFETQAGKQHIQATCALLKLSEDRAVQVTRGAIQKLYQGDSQLPVLLGTKDLLIKTTLYHFQQRLARLQLLTECLRIEQDVENHVTQDIADVLDSLDSTFQEQTRYRGLFRKLLTIACIPLVLPTREQLAPSHSLSKSTSTRTLQDSFSASNTTTTDAAFTKTILEETRSQTLCERSQAMEALLVLFYHRIDGGVRRNDLCLMLQAFQVSGIFHGEKRLAQLAGLICAESIQLWRAFETDMDPREGWATKHPLLLGVVSSGDTDSAQIELEALKTVLLDGISHGETETFHGPQALALLSLGLLLRLAHESLAASDAGTDSQAYWRTFAASGMEIATLANEWAFEYLYHSIKDLCSSSNASSAPKRSASHGHFYDWQLSNTQNNPLLLGAEPEDEAAADVVAYTSIAREVLAASVAAFPSILSLDTASATENIGLLCNLAAAIYQSNPLLSEEFWNSWQSFIAPNPPSVPLPMCALMEVSHRLATMSLEAYHQQRMNNNLFLPAVAPFFRLLASLCHSPNIVQVTIGILPPGMVRATLLACRLPVAVTGSDEYNQSRLFALDALAALAKIGNSSDCLESLRLSLEDSHQQNQAIVDGPRVLGRILYSTRETAITEPVLRLMAHLLDGAPQQWALELARQCISPQEQQSILTAFLAPGMDTTHAAALVLAELIEHLTAVVFCKSFSDNDAVVFLHVLAEGILSSGTALVPSLCTSSSSIGKVPVAFETAQTILQLFTNFLKLIRTVIELHHSPKVSAAAVEVRDSLINTLATSVGLGETIAYYAAAPVSLSLAAQLSDALMDGQLVPSFPEADADNRRKYGAWQSVLSKESQLSTNESLVKKLLIKSIADIGAKDFDLEGIQQRGWTGGSDKLAPLNAAWSAIRLLSMWALHVEDIVKSHVEDSGAPLEGLTKELIDRLSPQGLLASLAPSPVPCRQNSSLATVWQSAGLSNFELLLPYLSSMDQDSSFSASIPSSVTLDFLHTCLVHVRNSCRIESVADTMLFHGVYRSARFSKVLVESVERAVSHSDKSELGRQEKTDIINGLLSLRLLCTCVEASPAVADRMLQLESNPIVPTLIKVASSARNLLGIEQSTSNEIFKSEASIVQMRLATGAISVLAALWTTARTIVPGQTGSAGSRLVRVVDDQTSFITDLMTTVMGYANANDIESKIVTSRESEYARCTLTTFMSKSLDILATEVAYFVCNRENTNPTLESLLLKTFFQPQRFTSFNGYKYAAESTAQFSSMEVNGVGNLTQPISLLQCFPATASRLLSQDFYTRENSFDVGSSARWLSENCGNDEVETEDIMAQVSIAYQLASCDLQMIASWKGFAEVLVYFSVDHATLPGNIDAGPSAERLLNLAQDTLRALHYNIEAINQAQVEVAADFMRGKSSRMAKILTELFLFFLEMGSQNEESSKLLDCDELIDLLELLTKTSEMLFTVLSSLPANATTIGDLETCCTLERRLLASAILIDSLIEAKGSLSGEQQRREKDIYNSLCRVGGKVLKVLGEVIKQTNKTEVGIQAKEKDNRESLYCCISLFTVLVAKGQGSQMTDASYFKLISETLKEYDVLKQLIAHGMTASAQAATAIGASISGANDLEYRKRGPSSEETANLIIVHSVLDLSYSVAEANNPEMLSIFIGTQLPQLVTRNPLYQNAGRVWTQHGVGTKPPRGYVFSNESAGAGMQDEPIAPGSLQIGSNDPVHAIWLTSMKVLQASLRSSTNCLHIQGTESIGKLFFNMSVEFLQIHRDPIISCLKYCGSKLTRNALLEATQILALTAELCKRDTRDVFLHQHGPLCEELVNWSKFVVVSVSKFLGASGTARELFRGLEEYESSDPDVVETGNFGSVPSKARHPLLSGRRLQDAKHEAYKFSHFAARCCERVTKLDFETGSTVPAQLRHLSLDRKSDEPLEQACRLSVTCDFALQMEKVAADCLSQAISTIWRTHPVSRSFKMFSEREAVQLDTMSLVQPGVVIGFRPAGGDGILADGGVDTFENLRFGRVCSSDTITRTWNVTILGRQGGDSFDAGSTEVVRGRQLAGIEDTSMRKAVASYLPGPDTMDALEKGCVSLSLGHLVLVLRWCHHQRFLSLKESSLSDGLAKTNTTARIAEQTVALLGAELAIHDEIGSALNMGKAERSQLDSQIYEMFADPEILRALDTNTMAASVHMQEGRMKGVINGSVWDSVRPQVCREVERTWKEMKEKEQARQKRAYGETSWFSGHLGRSRGYKSAFRG